jgi:hypothetical protein
MILVKEKTGLEVLELHLHIMELILEQQQP